VAGSHFARTALWYAADIRFALAAKSIRSACPAVSSVAKVAAMPLAEIAATA
jgi:hypothetical protein